MKWTISSIAQASSSKISSRPKEVSKVSETAVPPPQAEIAEEFTGGGIVRQR